MKAEIKAGAEFLKAKGATEVYIFGSWARGTALANSDIDFAARGLEDYHFYGLLAELEAHLHCPVDLVLLDDGSPFAAHVESKIRQGWAHRVL